MKNDYFLTSRCESHSSVFFFFEHFLTMVKYLIRLSTHHNNKHFYKWMSSFFFLDTLFVIDSLLGTVRKILVKTSCLFVCLSVKKLYPSALHNKQREKINFLPFKWRWKCLLFGPCRECLRYDLRKFSGREEKVKSEKSNFSSLVGCCGSAVTGSYINLTVIPPSD